MSPTSLERRGGSSAPGVPAVDGRLALFAADLRKRLRPACREWSDDEFEAVVDRIARTKLRSDDAAGEPWRV